MEGVLLRAISFIAVIALGCVLRRRGFFKEEDFCVLASIVTNVTLPASIIVNFSKTEVHLSMLLMCLVGFTAGVAYMSLGQLLGKDRNGRAFMTVNLTGYNIGTFTLPFASSFLGPQAVVITSMFDMGNSVVCLGLSYTIASMIKYRTEGLSLGRILKTLSKSVPLVVYILMTLISLLHIQMPQVVISIAEVIGNANPFLAMLVLGVGMKLSFNHQMAVDAARILFVRYAVATTLAVAFALVLPLPQLYRQTLPILVFSPISALVPVYTSKLKEDYGMSSTVNTISIVISIVVITSLLSAIR